MLKTLIQYLFCVSETCNYVYTLQTQRHPADKGSGTDRWCLAATALEVTNYGISAFELLEIR